MLLNPRAAILILGLMTVNWKGLNEIIIFPIFFFFTKIVSLNVHIWHRGLNYTELSYSAMRK